MESLRTLMFQLKINHRIIAHIDINDEGDEKVGNKTKWKCISTVINSLAIIFDWFLCRSKSKSFLDIKSWLFNQNFQSPQFLHERFLVILEI